MRRAFRWFAWAFLASSLLAGANTLAQQSNEEGKRKVKSRVTPVYPELARRMNVIGRVKIEVVIAPDGRVRSSKVIGGHPLLVNAALDALKEWRFAAASEETTQLVEFEFKGSREN
jgi:protein TonB